MFSFFEPLSLLRISHYSIFFSTPLLPNLSRVPSLLSYISNYEYLRSSPFSRASHKRKRLSLKRDHPSWLPLHFLKIGWERPSPHPPSCRFQWTSWFTPLPLRGLATEKPRYANLSGWADSGRRNYRYVGRKKKDRWKSIDLTDSLSYSYYHSIYKRE